MSAHRVAAFLVVTGLALAAGTAHAGRSCEARPLTVESLARGLGLAEQTARALDASGARAVVIARAGQDLSRWGLRWSHLGLAYRTTDGWRVVHKLNACGTATAGLYRQGLGPFFLDDPDRWEAAFVPLAPPLQARVAEVLADNRRAAALDTRAYSMVAYAWSTTYQQSNQWALETLASIVDRDIADREQAQAWLRLKGYAPATLRIDAFTRLGARLTRANVAFDDHPMARRLADRIDTVTVESVFDFLERRALAGPIETVP